MLPRATLRCATNPHANIKRERERERERELDKRKVENVRTPSNPPPKPLWCIFTCLSLMQT